MKFVKSVNSTISAKNLINLSRRAINLLKVSAQDERHQTKTTKKKLIKKAKAQLVKRLNQERINKSNKRGNKHKQYVNIINKPSDLQDNNNPLELNNSDNASLNNSFLSNASDSTQNTLNLSRSVDNDEGVDN